MPRGSAKHPPRCSIRPPQTSHHRRHHAPRDEPHHAERDDYGVIIRNDRKITSDIPSRLPDEWDGRVIKYRGCISVGAIPIHRLVELTPFSPGHPGEKGASPFGAIPAMVLSGGRASQPLRIRRVIARLLDLRFVFDRSLASRPFRSLGRFLRGRIAATDRKRRKNGEQHCQANQAFHRTNSSNGCSENVGHRCSSEPMARRVARCHTPAASSYYATKRSPHERTDFAPCDANSLARNRPRWPQTAHWRFGAATN